MKIRIHSVLITFTLLSLGLALKIDAVVPAPDGGYPGGNTAEGQNALFSLATGGLNTAVGWVSLRSNVAGSFNTAVGSGALFANAESQNTAVGAAALFNNTTGGDNTANGVRALLSNIDGFSNTTSGVDALQMNTSGDHNTAMGSGALLLNTTGGYNIAVGSAALSGNRTGGSNIGIGYGTLSSNNAGDGNIAIGYFSGENVTGDNNICIGFRGGPGPGESNTLHIGDEFPTGAGQSACYIGGIAGQTVSPSGAGQVFVDNFGKLGVFTSSQRFKRNIEPMQNMSEAILALKPVTFQYKSDAKNTPCFGLIAEEVEKVNPDLVVRDKGGKPYSVRYEAVNAMLLNEFLKEHRKVEQMQKQIEALTAGLQRVSDQLELSRPAPQTVLNDQ